MPAPARPRRLSLRARWFAVLAAALLVFAACGSGDDDTDAVDAGDAPTADENGGGSDADVVVTAVDIDFPTREFAASAGEVTIEYVNDGNIRHTLVMEGVEGWETLEVTSNGDTATGTIELEAGEYTLFCDVPGHRSAGMEGTLTVS